MNKQKTKLKETEIGKIPEEWEVKELGELASFRYGLGESADQSGEYIYIRITDINPDGFLNRTGLTFIKQNKVKKECVLQKGDVLVARTGATFAKTYIFREEFKATYGGFLIKIVFGDILNNEFFFQFSRSKFYWNQAHNLVSGCAQPQFNANVISKLIVPFPPTSEQESISKILSDLDYKIELNNQMNKTLEKIGQTIFRHWFVDFEFPHEKGKPYKASGGKMIDSDLGEMPKGWRVGLLKDLVSLSKESSKPFENPSNLFFHYSIQAFDNNKIPTTELGNTIKSNKFIVKRNSILISKLNPRIPRIWAIGTINESLSVCSTEFQVIVPKESIYYSFVYFLLTSEYIEEIMKSQVTGTSSSHQRVRPEDILNIPIIIPENTLVSKFEHVLKNKFLLTNIHLSQIQSLSNIRDSLLPKLMSGRIRVPVGGDD